MYILGEEFLVYQSSFRIDQHILLKLLIIQGKYLVVFDLDSISVFFVIYYLLRTNKVFGLFRRVFD